MVTQETSQITEFELQKQDENRLVRQIMKALDAKAPWRNFKLESRNNDEEVIANESNDVVIRLDPHGRWADEKVGIEFNVSNTGEIFWAGNATHTILGVLYPEFAAKDIEVRWGTDNEALNNFLKQEK